MTQTNVNVQMQIRRDTAANWQSTNPVLLAGEWGYITDTGKFKIGNGSTNFTFLPDAVLSTFGGTLTDHLKISNQKELRLSDDTANTANEHYSSFKAGSQSVNINYTLPTTAPSDNQYLKCSAAGVLSWDTFTGTDIADLVSNDANNRILTATGTTNSFNAEQNLTFDGSTLVITGAINSSGNLTIQNDAPKIFLTDASNNPDFSLQNANGSFVVFDDTNSAARLEIDGNGNVGIGSAPASGVEFHVKNSTADGAFLLEGTSSTLGSYIQLQNNDNTANSYTSIYGADAGGQATNEIRFVNVNDPNNEGKLIFRTRTSGGSLGDRLTIDGNGFLTANGDLDVLGELEVGQTSANAKLKVSYSTGVIGYFESTQSAANVDNIVLNSTQTNSSSNLVFQINGGTTAQGIIRLNGDNSLDFYNGATPTFKARLNSSGHLGLNVTSPSGVLHAYQATGTQRSYFESGDNHTFIRLLGGSASHNSGIEFFSGSSTNTANITALSTGSIVFDTGSTNDAVTIDTYGRLLIGNTTAANSGADDLVIEETGHSVGITLRTSTTANGNIYFSDGTSGSDEFRGFIQYLHASNKFNIGTNGTDKVEIDTNGHINILDGNLSVASGHGIDFSHVSDGSRSVSSNLLNDYEEGTFSPTITSTGTDPSQNTYAHQNGYYVKIGRLVHVRADVLFNSSGVSGGTGLALLSNLPFINQNLTRAYGMTMAVGYSPNWYNNGCPVGGYMEQNQYYCYLMPYNTNGETFTQGADVGGGTRLIAGITYMTS